MGGKQHVDMFRKLLLRRELLKYVTEPGAAYVPFIGDGDIAGQLYYHKPKITKVFGADLNPERTATCGQRYPEMTLATGDCDVWPFASDVVDSFSVGDFDAYSHPYASFLSWWNWAEGLEWSRLNNRLVLFFTDGHRQGIIRSKILIDPENNHRKIEDINTRRRLFHMYPKLVIQPWFVKAVRGWKVEAAKFYLRAGMIYWGAVISRKVPIPR